MKVENNYPGFGQRLKHIRILKNMKQAEIGNSLGSSPNYICRLEKGIIKNPSVESFSRIANAMNMDSLEILYVLQIDY